MPVVAFRDPQSGETIPLDKAAAHFEEQGIMPADVVQAMIDDIQHGTHAKGTRLSPSLLDPETHCRRQIVGERYLDIVQDPFSLWAALEGTLFHWGMVKAGENLPEWRTNVRVPDPSYPFDTDHSRMRDSVVELEVFPGIFLSGEIDRLKDEGATFEIDDHKTSRYRSKELNAQQQAENIQSWGTQVNCYRYIYEDVTGKKCSNLFVWRTYRGSYDNTRTFRKFPIPLIPRDVLWARIGEWVTSLRDYLLEADAANGDVGVIEGLVRSIPMDGFDKRMFNGTKCEKYCALYETCFRLAGKVSF